MPNQPVSFAMQMIPNDISTEPSSPMTDIEFLTMFSSGQPVIDAKVECPIVPPASQAYEQPIVVRKSHFTKPVRLERLSLRGLHFEDCAFDDSIEIIACESRDVITLTDCTVSGDCCLNSTTLSDESGRKQLTVRGCKLQRNLHCRLLKAASVDLTHSTISGDLDLTAAHVAGDAVLWKATVQRSVLMYSANDPRISTQIDGSLMLNKATISGSVFLVSVNIRGHANFTGATISEGIICYIEESERRRPPSVPTRVGGDLRLVSTTLGSGGLALRGLKVRRHVVISQLALSGPLELAAAPKLSTIGARESTSGEDPSSAFEVGGDIRITNCNLDDELRMQGIETGGFRIEHTEIRNGLAFISTPHVASHVRETAIIRHCNTGGFFVIAGVTFEKFLFLANGRIDDSLFIAPAHGKRTSVVKQFGMHTLEVNGNVVITGLELRTPPNRADSSSERTAVPSDELLALGTNAIVLQALTVKGQLCYQSDQALAIDVPGTLRILNCNISRDLRLDRVQMQGLEIDATTVGGNLSLIGMTVRSSGAPAVTPPGLLTYVYEETPTHPVVIHNVTVAGNFACGNSLLSLTRVKGSFALLNSTITRDVFFQALNTQELHLHELEVGNDLYFGDVQVGDESDGKSKYLASLSINGLTVRGRLRFGGGWHGPKVFGSASLTNSKVYRNWILNEFVVDGSFEIAHLDIEGNWERGAF